MVLGAVILLVIEFAAADYASEHWFNEPSLSASEHEMPVYVDVPLQSGMFFGMNETGTRLMLQGNIYFGTQIDWNFRQTSIRSRNIDNSSLPFLCNNAGVKEVILGSDWNDLSVVGGDANNTYLYYAGYNRLKVQPGDHVITIVAEDISTGWMSPKPIPIKATLIFDNGTKTDITAANGLTFSAI